MSGSTPERWHQLMWRRFRGRVATDFYRFETRAVAFLTAFMVTQLLIRFADPLELIDTGHIELDVPASLAVTLGVTFAAALGAMLLYSSIRPFFRSWGRSPDRTE